MASQGKTKVDIVAPTKLLLQYNRARDGLNVYRVALLMVLGLLCLIVWAAREAVAEKDQLIDMANHELHLCQARQAAVETTP